MTDTTVLLVDDEPDFTTVLAERLRARGLGVDTAASGEAALEMAARRTYDAILLDMAMPGLDGIATLRRLLEVNPDLQVILLTGRATLAQGVEAIKLGALDLLEKPAELDVVVERITDAATRRSSLEDQRIAERMKDITRAKGW